MTRLALASALVWLRSEAGTALLAEAAQLPPDRLTRLTRLRRSVSAELATAAVELLELRQRARAKFSQAETMFFTAEGLEQSTSEVVARHRAQRFPAGVPVLDACCGIGGDARALAERGPVLAMDSDLAAAVCARANAKSRVSGVGCRVSGKDFGTPGEPQSNLDLFETPSEGEAPNAQHPTPDTRHPVRVLCADVTQLDLRRLRDAGFEAAFFDPSRRVETRFGTRRRARHAEEYQPPLSWAKALCDYFPSVGIKVSPAIDDGTLHAMGAWIEFISERGECKEAVLWYGPPAEMLEDGNGRAYGEPYCATVLKPGHRAQTILPWPCNPLLLSPPRAWLYEPDPAVIRAHLIAQVAERIGQAAQLDPQIAYLTSDVYAPTPFATVYRVLDWLPFSVKAVQARLRALGRHVVAIKKRGVPMEPEELRARLTGAEPGSPPAVVVLTRMADKPVAILCEPPADAMDSARHKVVPIIL